METIASSAFFEAHKALEKVRSDESFLDNLTEVGKIFSSILQEGGTLFSCGNGGSMCDAMHFAEELSGKFRESRKALRAVAISDSGYLSCVANDYGYEQVFSRYLEAHGRRGDALLAISTSGSSKNVVNAALTAKSLDMKVVSLTGKASRLGEMSDIDLCTNTGSLYADRVQEIHIKCIHILIEMIEKKLF